MNEMNTRAGFAAIIGAPNAGKSTLVNALVGEKISIVTHKIQTTRFQVRGIAMHGNAQIVLVDTPGIFEPRQRLDRSMVHAAWSGVADADVIVHVVDAPSYSDVRRGSEPSAQDKKAAQDTDRVVKGLVKRSGDRPVYLALNKIDGMEKEHLLELITIFEKTNAYTDILMISALKGHGIKQLANKLAENMPVGAYLYPVDQAADIPSRLMAAEITREKLFMRLHNELPYASHVETEKWTSMKNGDIKIEQIIYVRRKSQKPIVLGKGGQTIKQIGQMARRDMTESFGKKVHLFLFVKVRENWSEDRSKYLESGLEFDV
ncbi:MAG: GTPase Era [Robiginitomaculum sp.]|nr:GTPase Era [Robiginitomaculum sp.]